MTKLAPRTALVLILALVLAPAGAGRATGDDCGTGGDAGPLAATAPLLALPFFACQAELSTSTDVDAYRIEAEAGDVLVLTPNDASGPMELCLYDSSSTNVVCSTGAGFTHEVAQDETFVLVADEFQGQPVSYSFSLSRKLTPLTGSVLLPHAATSHAPGHGATGLVGPALDGVDGSWVALPSTSTGGEAIRLSHQGRIVDVAFYDDAGSETGPACPGVVHACAVPTGTTRLLVSGGGTVPFMLPNAEWALDYLH